jgi:hypothetical protein
LLRLRSEQGRLLLRCVRQRAERARLLKQVSLLLRLLLLLEDIGLRCCWLLLLLRKEGARLLLYWLLAKGARLLLQLLLGMLAERAGSGRKGAGLLLLWLSESAELWLRLWHTPQTLLRRSRCCSSSSRLTKQAGLLLRRLLLEQVRSWLLLLLLLSSEGALSKGWLCCCLSKCTATKGARLLLQLLRLSKGALPEGRLRRRLSKYARRWGTESGRLRLRLSECTHGGLRREQIGLLLLCRSSSACQCAEWIVCIQSPSAAAEGTGRGRCAPATATAATTESSTRCTLRASVSVARHGCAFVRGCIATAAQQTVSQSLVRPSTPPPPPTSRSASSAASHLTHSPAPSSSLRSARCSPTEQLPHVCSACRLLEIGCNALQGSHSPVSSSTTTVDAKSSAAPNLKLQRNSQQP